MRRGLTAVLVLILLAVSSLWLLYRVESVAEAPTPQIVHAPDFYMEDFTTLTMDERGAPHRELRAERLEHFPDTRTKELRAPHFVLRGGPQPPWEVRSERAWISPDGDEVLLQGSVRAWRQGPDGVPLVELRSREIRVLPESSYAEGAEPVVIRTPSSETRGVGMRLFLEEERLELLSKVTTRYDGQPQP